MNYLKPRLIIIGLALIALAIFKPQVFNPDHPGMPNIGLTTSSGEELPKEDGYQGLRQIMVDQIRSQYGMRDENILHAVNVVPRHLFFAGPDIGIVYSNQVIFTDQGQTIPAAYQTAWMIKLLQVKPGDKVLLVGDGSAYTAALVTEMGISEVFCLEGNTGMATNAALLLERLGYQTISLKQGGIFEGWPGNAPYHAILINQATDQPPPSLSAQLVSGGRLVIPIRLPDGQQRMWQFYKEKDGSLSGFPHNDLSFPEAGNERSETIPGFTQLPAP